MRRLILTTGLLAAALMATPQSASAQGNQPVGGGGGQQQPNLSEPRSGGSQRVRPGDESVGAGERRDIERGTRGMAPSDQPVGGGGGQQDPNPSRPRR